jgi:NAD(P)-dependent dehydrogenase (short-subunit alcohol dehydrogenase family)
MRLDGHVAFITGGTRGIGGAIAARLAEAGCHLVLHGLTDDTFTAQIVAQCESFGVRVHTLHADLARPPSEYVDRLVERVFALEPSTNLLVNNAGTYCDKPFLEMDEATFDRTWQVNVASGYFLTQQFARRWIASGTRGRVLFTGSINGELAEADHTAYDASKGAVRTLVRSLCVALAPHGIRVNSMAPGLVVTPLTRPALTTDNLAWMKLHTPNGQVPGAEACAGAALFLLSDEAEHIHGQTLYVDGGMSVWQQPDLPAALRPLPQLAP